MSGWSLLDPWFLGLAPVCWLLLAWRLRRPRAALPAASLQLMDALPRSLRERLVHLPAILKALGVTALALALARPVTRDVLPLREKGVDIMLLIDVSSSMNTTDMEDTGKVRRIEAARDKALEFAAGRKTDRVGLMTFALYPELRCPLTLDMGALSAFLRGVETVQPGGPEDATGIGVGLAEAVRFMEKSKAASKVVVLLTDGQNNVDEVTPDAAGKLAADAGIRVYTIGLGHGAPDPFFGRFVPIDFSGIQKVAETTGGRFFAAEDEETLGEVYGVIDQMEKVELEDPRYRTTDRFGAALLAGVALLALALVLESTWLRGAP